MAVGAFIAEAGIQRVSTGSSYSQLSMVNTLAEQLNLLGASFIRACDEFFSFLVELSNRTCGIHKVLNKDMLAKGGVSLHECGLVAAKLVDFVLKHVWIVLDLRPWMRKSREASQLYGQQS